MGIAKGTYLVALAYAKEREQFGTAITKFQAIAFKLAGMATEIEASELLTLKSGGMKNQGVLQERFGNSKYAPCPLLVNMVTVGKLGCKSEEGLYT